MSVSRLALCLLSLFAVFVAPAPPADAGIQLKQGDHICLVGNELGERMQHHNFWEGLLHHSYADLNLTVRNLCFPGDEPYERIRSLDFGDPDSHLKHSKADVVMYFFGFNESFAGEDGLEDFTAEVTRLVEETRQQDYSGRGNARVVLVSPIAFENTGDPNITDGTVQNENLAKYAAALKTVAEQTGAAFADVYSPTKALFESDDRRLTLNGCHLNADGYRAFAPILMQALGLNVKPGEPSESLAAEIKDKNFHWWHRYRAVNGYSIYGKRGLAGQDGTGTYNNRDVMERERAVLDQMTANRDQRIWALAQGKTVADKCDDSNTPSFIDVVTNVGGEDDKNAKAGKLGSLDYLPGA
ncbi:MAG: SGNH/GDSL hydrolase family protein, partial [Planctomycetaceae bacterium]|nr:SGNH/GDSL hydrolase family protein [Planctomycetaceae bacterium]